MLVRKGLPCYNVPVGRRALPVVSPASVTEEGRDAFMTAYEIISTVIAILNLLIAVYKIKRK